MPELPEVETIKLGLEKKIVGLKIKKVQVLNPKSFIGDPKLVERKNILRIWRRGKILGIDLDKNVSLLFHLKMSGQLILIGKKEKLIGGHPTLDMTFEMPNKSTRVIFEFSDNAKLYFNDQRKFGWIKLVNRKSRIINHLLEYLGPEPLRKGFSWRTLKLNLLNHKSLPVKVALMDQKIVAGVGNIYSNEACFMAKIDPRKKVGNLTDSEFKRIYQGVVESLKQGIKYGGSTRVHFVDPDGKKGYFLDYALVYWRDGLQCRECGGKIKKIQLRGRGTYYCPKCQNF